MKKGTLVFLSLTHIAKYNKNTNAIFRQQEKMEQIDLEMTSNLY